MPPLRYLLACCPALETLLLNPWVFQASGVWGKPTFMSRTCGSSALKNYLPLLRAGICSLPACPQQSVLASQVHACPRHSHCQRPSKTRWALDLQFDFSGTCSANLCDQTHAATHRLDAAWLNVHRTVYCQEKSTSWMQVTWKTNILDPFKDLGS